MRLALAAVLAALVLLGRAQYAVPSYTGSLLIQPTFDQSLCMAPESLTDGAPVKLTTCNDTQGWNFKSGSVVYGTSNNLLCLSIGTLPYTANGPLKVRMCKDDATQKFNYANNQLTLESDNPQLICVECVSKATSGSVVQVNPCNNPLQQSWDVGYFYSNLPSTSQNGQSGTNDCKSNPDECQTAWINNVNDFCLWAPASNEKGQKFGPLEQNVVAWCIQDTHSARVIPKGTLTGVHFVKTNDYVQVTGIGDLKNLGIVAGDGGGQLSPHGTNGGNPIGGLVFGTVAGVANRQFHEWTSFIGASIFCFRGCWGLDASSYCNNAFDNMGCEWNMPGNYGAGFDTCLGADDVPMGSDMVWWAPSPVPQPASTTSCTPYSTIPYPTAK